MRKIKLFLITAVTALLACSVAFAQNLSVKGAVSDPSGAPIPGVTVIIDGTLKGSVTNAQGQYTISVPSDGALRFASVGYQEQTIPVNGQAVINVTLQEDAQLLDETIIVAFGSSTKEAFTGSATVLKSDDISRTQSSDATRAIEGLVPGVQMTTSSGTLGSSPSIRIRGTSSISAGNAPLYVIDGIPYNGDMNNINTADIESITIQKDAASNALYGARGANGVIMITTKKAKAGEAVVNVDAKWGLNTKALQNYDYISDPGQYYEAYYSSLYWYYINGGMSPSAAHLKAAATTVGGVDAGGLGYNVYTVPDGELLIGSNGKLNPNAKLGRVVNYDGQDYLLKPDDWLKEAYVRSLRQEYNVNVSGTSGKANFYASFGYLNNKGIIRNADMHRYTAMLKTDYQAKSWLKIGGSAQYANFEYNNGNSDEGSAGSTGNVFGTAAGIAPIYPLYIRDAQGNILRDKNGYKRYDWGNGANAGMERAVSSNSNALQGAELNVNRSEGNALNATGFAEARFLRHFKANFNAGTGLQEWRVTEMNNMFYGQFAPDGGVLSVAHRRSFSINLQEYLEYSNSIGNHNFSLMAGHENLSRTSTALSAEKSQMFDIENLELNGAVVDKKSASSSKGFFNSEGYFARALYDFDSRVFASVSFRREASSLFSSEHWWGNFWSAGAGWLINKENWFNVSWIDLLKLKASIGSQGNDSIGSYLYTDTYSIVSNAGEVATVFGAKGNDKISWEKNTTFNSGIDFEILGGRLSGTAEYFYRKTADMLFFFTVPESLGYGGYYDNIGDMRNSGVELGLNYVIFDKKDFHWSVNANATHYTNKIIRLPEARKTVTMEGYSGFASDNKFIGEGLPLNTFKLPKYAGVDHETGLPMWYKDVLDADGKVTGRETTTSFSSATDYLCGDPTPKVYGGFGTSIDWHGFDFSVQFTYSIGGKCYDTGYANLMANPEGTSGYAFHKDVLKAWTPDNKNSDIPRFVYKDTDIAAASDRFLTDASYLNIQNAQIGYTLPQKLTRRIQLSKVRCYVTCDNIWYVSARRGLDPRYSFTGATNNAYNSPVRTLSGGINITF